MTDKTPATENCRTCDLTYRAGADHRCTDGWADKTPATEAGRPACTCLPLNRRLMAHLLRVDEGSVHEQGCVERAVADALREAAERVRALPWPIEEGS